MPIPIATGPARPELWVLDFGANGMAEAVKTRTEKDRQSARDRSASFLTEPKAMQPHAGWGWWCGANSNIRPHDRGIRRTQALGEIRIASVETR